MRLLGELSGRRPSATRAPPARSGRRSESPSGCRSPSAVYISMQKFEEHGAAMTVDDMTGQDKRSTPSTPGPSSAAGGSTRDEPRARRPVSAARSSAEVGLADAADRRRCPRRRPAGQREVAAMPIHARPPALRTAVEPDPRAQGIPGKDDQPPDRQGDQGFPPRDRPQHLHAGRGRGGDRAVRRGDPGA